MFSFNKHDIKAIFKEKVFGTDHFLVSAEIIAYLKWLIMFKDSACDQCYKVAGDLSHTLYYQVELQRLVSIRTTSSG